jgi:hypothetical protein
MIMSWSPRRHTERKVKLRAKLGYGFAVVTVAGMTFALMLVGLLMLVAATGRP